MNDQPPFNIFCFKEWIEMELIYKFLRQEFDLLAGSFSFP